MTHTAVRWSPPVPDSYEVAIVEQGLSSLGYSLVGKNAEFIILYNHVRLSPVLLPHENGLVRREAIDSALRYEFVDAEAFWAYVEAL